MKLSLSNRSLVSYQKALNLESNHLPDHVNVLAGASDHKDIFQLRFIKDFENW